MKSFFSILTTFFVATIAFSSCDSMDGIAPDPEYGISANIGISYKIAPLHNILLEIGGNYGFRKLQKSIEIGENRIGAATVVVGYAYKLK